MKVFRLQVKWEFSVSIITWMKFCVKIVEPPLLFARRETTAK